MFYLYIIANIAAGKTVTLSGLYSGSYPAYYLTDENDSTMGIYIY